MTFAICIVKIISCSIHDDKILQTTSKKPAKIWARHIACLEDAGLTFNSSQYHHHHHHQLPTTTRKKKDQTNQPNKQPKNPEIYFSQLQKPGNQRLRCQQTWYLWTYFLNNFLSLQPHMMAVVKKPCGTSVWGH